MARQTVGGGNFRKTPMLRERGCRGEWGVMWGGGANDKKKKKGEPTPEGG